MEILLSPLTLGSNDLTAGQDRLVGQKKEGEGNECRKV